ncbi:hypothetical protein OKJ48_19115, partial [Streptomyces kunmingensis]|nr:hypothetical protein [Streptomyces kunmingensis]
MTRQSAATLRSRYAEQAASDLAENRRRQRELGAKLRMLQQEEALLADIMELAERADLPQDPPPLPEQAQDEPVLARPASRSRPGTRTRTPAKAASGGESRQPLLGTLLMGLLAA